MLPRLVRLKDAPAYVGLDRRRFDEEVRPYLTEIREEGRVAVRFDRLELDAYSVYVLEVRGRPPRRRPLWHNEERQDSPAEGDTGGSTSESADTEKSARALARRILQKRSAT